MGPLARPEAAPGQSLDAREKVIVAERPPNVAVEVGDGGHWGQMLIGPWHGLRVTLDEEVDASTQPIEVGACGHTGECRSVELARRGLCECSG